MDKLTYLNALSDALEGKLSDRERDEIIRYYSEYFADAGEGREGEVIAELGSPEALARRLLAEGSYERRGDGGKTRDAEGTTNAKAKGMLILLFLLFFLFYFGACHNWGHKSDKVGEFIDKRASSMSDTEQDSSSGFWSFQDNSLEAFTAMDIDVAVGSVTISSGEDYTLSIDQRGMPEGYEARWEVKRGRLEITSRGSSENINGNAQIDITMPYDVQMSDIEIKTLLGNLCVSEVWASDEISVETYLGDVECYDVKTSGDIDLSTKMGDITFSLSEPLGAEQEVELDTDLGDIEAQLDFYSDQCTYELETKNGEVEINGESFDKTVKRHNGTSFVLKAETSMGDISVFFKEKQ